MAETMFKGMLEVESLPEPLSVNSAGISCAPDLCASNKAQLVMKEMGLSLKSAAGSGMFR